MKDINKLELKLIRNGYTILICDDEPEIRSLYKKILNDEYFSRIDTASDAISAKNLMSIFNYDLIITDFNMGGEGKNADSILKFIKEHYEQDNYPDLLIVSGHNHKMLDLGQVNKKKILSLPKPFNNDKFLNIILGKYKDYLTRQIKYLKENGEL